MGHLARNADLGIESVVSADARLGLGAGKLGVRFNDRQCQCFQVAVRSSVLNSNLLCRASFDFLTSSVGVERMKTWELVVILLILVSVALFYLNSKGAISTGAVSGSNYQ